MSDRGIVAAWQARELPEGIWRSRGEPWMREGLGPVLLPMLLLLVACVLVRIAAVHVVSVSGPHVAVGSRCELLCARCVCVASVPVAMAERAMEWVLGAAVAPSGPHLKSSERRPIKQKIFRILFGHWVASSVTWTCGAAPTSLVCVSLRSLVDPGRARGPSRSRRLSTSGSGPKA